MRICRRGASFISFFYRGARLFLCLDGYISRENNQGASADVAHLSFRFFIAELGYFPAWMVTLAGKITNAHLPTWRIFHFVFFYRGARLFLRLDGYISRENNQGASADVAHLPFRFFYRGARFFLRLDGYISRENNQGASADVAHLPFRFF